MKKAWSVLAFLAVVNLLAVAGFFAWLKSTDRLNGERAAKIRAMLAETITAEKARLAEEAAKAEAEVKQKAERQRLAGLPESAGDQLDRQREADDVRQAMILRLREEVQQLKATLARQEEQLAADKSALADAEKRLAEREATLTRAAGTASFKSALASLESQKPAAARAVLQALIDERKQDEVIAYLAAMQDRTRSKIVAEFIKADEKVAAGLLEQLRTRGVTVTPDAARTAAP